MLLRNTISIFAIGVFHLAIIQSASAQTEKDNPKTEVTKTDSSAFTIGVQIRPRFEYRHGFKKPLADGLNAASFVEQRSRIWFDYKNSKFHLRVNLQDIRMWGSTNQIYKTDPSMFNAYEAYGEYFINKKWTVKFGRQALNYDNARFMGNLNWAQQGRSHDAVLVKYQSIDKSFKIHIGGGINQFQTEPKYLSYKPYVNDNNKHMLFVWVHKDWKKLSSSFLIHNDTREIIADSAMNNANRQTFAIIPSYKSGKLKIDIEAYYQIGRNAAKQNVNAYLFSLSATYKTKLTPITLGVDMASGTAYNDSANVDNSWNPLYGTNHKFYGFMDYFYVGNPHGQAAGTSSGLTDIYLKTNFKLGESKKHYLLAHFHYFMSPVELIDLTDPTGTNTVSSGLGTEIDLVYKYALSKGVVANVGYSQMLATDSMKQIKGMADVANGYTKTGTNNWMWVQINFNTNVFSFKHK